MFTNKTTGTHRHKSLSGKRIAQFLQSIFVIAVPVNYDRNNRSSISFEHADAELAKYNEKKGFTFPLYPDKNRAIFGAFAKNLIPRTYLIGKDGKVIYAGKGYTEEEFAGLMDKIGASLK